MDQRPPNVFALPFLVATANQYPVDHLAGLVSTNGFATPHTGRHNFIDELFYRQLPTSQMLADYFSAFFLGISRSFHPVPSTQFAI